MHNTSLVEREPSFHSVPGPAICGERRAHRSLRRWVLLGSLLLLAACGTPPETLRVDVQAYLERARAWSGVESHTMRTIELIFATQFVDEAEVRRQIAESTPRVQQQIALAKQYTPRTADVEAVHKAYLKAWDDLLVGYDAIVAGFDSGEYSNLARGRTLLEGWQAAILQTARQLRDLAERTNALSPQQPA